MRNEIIDRKFRFVAVNPCSNRVITEENGIVFGAKDKALIPALKAYKKACVSFNCGPEHIESIDLLLERVREYQENVECKVSDTDLPCEIDRCIGGMI